MSRSRWLVGLGVVLLALSGAVGCKVTDFNLALMFQMPLGPEDQIIPGSVNTVALSIRDEMKAMGMDARVTREGQAVKIIATRRDGQAFNLLLTNRKTETGEATRVQFEWDTLVDGKFKGDVVTRVVALAPEKPAAE